MSNVHHSGVMKETCDMLDNKMLTFVSGKGSGWVVDHYSQIQMMRFMPCKGESESESESSDSKKG